ncbi:MAG: acetyltransferase [Ginsengibacter sp.]
MLIIGAGGHAKELLDILNFNGEEEIFFYDDVARNSDSKLFNTYRILKNTKEAAAYFQEGDKRFLLGTGGTKIRKVLADKFGLLGGKISQVISKRAYISAFDVFIGEGVNIMHNVTIEPSVTVGKGSLINLNSTIHHDSSIGEYCEIGPGVCITGNCRIGDFTFIGSGVIITPNITVGNNVVIGAGSVVTNDIQDNTTVVGIPAKALNK